MVGVRTKLVRTNDVYYAPQVVFVGTRDLSPCSEKTVVVFFVFFFGTTTIFATRGRGREQKGRMIRWMLLLLSLLLLLFCEQVSSQRPKILCLHGGNGSPSSMASAIDNLVASLPGFDFVFARGGYSSNGGGGGSLWIPDPPGGKGEPTTDPGIANVSVQNLNTLVEEQGPFFGILGYSQGAAMTTVYLSEVAVGTFQVAITFCGYLTTTHLGLLDRVNAQSPFGNIPHLVWMGAQDFTISNSMTNDMAAVFTDPTVIVSTNAGHAPPRSNDPTFGQVISWIQSRSQSGGGESPTTSAPTTTSEATTPTVPTLAPVNPPSELSSSDATAFFGASFTSLWLVVLVGSLV